MQIFVVEIWIDRPRRFNYICKDFKSALDIFVKEYSEHQELNSSEKDEIDQLIFCPNIEAFWDKANDLGDLNGWIYVTTWNEELEVSP